MPGSRSATGVQLCAWLALAAATCVLTPATRAVADAPDAVSPGLRFVVDLQGEGRHERAVVWISGRRIRIDHKSPGERRPARALVYLGGESRFISIDSVDETYVEVDRTLIAAAGLGRDAARREVDARMSRLPPTIHSALERLLGAREDGAIAASKPIEVHALDESERVGPLTCRKRVLLNQGETIAEICVVDWSTIGLTLDDLEIFRQLANFQRELMGARALTPLELVPNQSFELMVQFDGFPLYLKGVGGGLRGEIRVSKVDRVDVPLDLFAPPRTYAVKSVYSLLLGDSADPVGRTGSDAAPAAPAAR